MTAAQLIAMADAAFERAVRQAEGCGYIMRRLYGPEVSVGVTPAGRNVISNRYGTWVVGVLPDGRDWYVTMTEHRGVTHRKEAVQ